MPLILKNIIRFIVLLLLQVLIFNNMDSLGLGSAYILPQIYVLFILLLPFETPVWLTIILSFLIGILVDFSLNTEGLHAFASCTMGYLRPRLTKSLSPRDGYDFNSEPTLRDQGISWFLAYGGILILAHHFLLFYLEKLSWSNFFSTLLTVLLSSVITLLIVVIYQYIVQTRRR